MKGVVKQFFVVIVCMGLGIILLASATTLWQNYYPTSGTIGELTIYINKLEYPDEKVVDWGTCQPGWIYGKNLTVENVGLATLKVSVIPENLATDWTLTWTNNLDANLNGTILSPTEVVEGWLNISLPITAIGSWPEWGFYVNGEEV